MRHIELIVAEREKHRRTLAQAQAGIAACDQELRDMAVALNKELRTVSSEQLRIA